MTSALSIFDRGRITEVLLRLGATFMRDAKITFSYPWSFALTIADVAVSVLIARFISIAVGGTHLNYGVAGITYFAYLAINLAFMRFYTTTLMSAADVIRSGAGSGTLELVLASPTGLPTLVVAATVWPLAYAAFQIVIYLFVASFFGLSFTHVNVPILMLILAVVILSAIPLGILFAGLAVRFNTSGPIDFLVSTSTNVFGGIYLPLTALPPLVQLCGWFLPVTHALSAIRGVLYGGPVQQIMAELVWLICATVILLPISLGFLELMIRRAKLHGTLTHY